MKKVAMYVRVSTYDQHPENQLMALKEYINNHTDENGNKDMQIYKSYVDFTSGANRNRTELDRLMQDARQHKFKTVVFWKVDRLGRSLIHLIQIVEEWNKLGIDFVVTTLGIDTSTSSGKLIFGILAQIAEFERELTRERTILSLERRKKEGKPVGRPKGSRDKKRRRKSGYHLRWANAGK